MEINKIFKTALLVGALSLPFFSNSNAQEKPRLYFDGSIKYEQNLVTRIDKVPLEMRTVPRFPYYPWDDRDGLVIKENYFSPCERISLGAKFGGAFPINKNIDFILGLGLDYIFNAKKEFFNKRDVEDFSDEKTSNVEIATCEKPPVSDVYFSVHPAYIGKLNDIIRPVIFSELEIKASKNISLGIGAEIYNEKIVLENGWNRSGQTERNKTYELASMGVGKIYGSIKLNREAEKGTISYSIDFGLNKIFGKSITDFGKDMELKFKDNSWFVGFKVGQKI